MKKIIRLTESDLHKIVKNSVKRILKESQLNELDPRTYASYAQKRKAQGQYDKARKGYDAAIDAFDDQYGSTTMYPRYNRGENNFNYHMFDDFTTAASQKGADGRPDAEMINRRNPQSLYVQGSHLSNRGGAHRDDYGKFTNKNQAIIDKGENVANQMYHGDGRYVKGKGWK